MSEMPPLVWVDNEVVNYPPIVCLPPANVSECGRELLSAVQVFQRLRQDMPVSAVCSGFSSYFNWITFL